MQVVPRGPSAEKELKIRWNFPVYTPEKADDGTSTVGEYALPLDRVFSEISGGDKRPMLILRECLVCNGTDDALLKSQPDNEKTLLMMSWFNCVKLPVDVKDKDTHPFHKLFEDEKPAHLYVCDFDGSNLRPLESERSRTELWDVMSEAMERNYEKDFTKSLKGMAKVLDEFDVADARVLQLSADLEAALEKKGPKSSRAKKLTKSLAEARANVEKVRAKLTKLQNLGLIEREAKPLVSKEG